MNFFSLQDALSLYDVSNYSSLFALSGSGSPFDFKSHEGIRGVAQLSISWHEFVLT
jgi:hypothetical protein